MWLGVAVLYLRGSRTCQGTGFDGHTTYMYPSDRLWESCEFSEQGINTLQSDRGAGCEIFVQVG